MSSSDFREAIDTGRIFIIGHSVGGHTALSLIGGKFALQSVLQGARDSVIRNRLAGRMLKDYAQIPPSQAEIDSNGGDYRDARIRKAVLLDPVPIWPGFTSVSLQGVTVPVLYIGCKQSEIFDSEAVKSALANIIPNYQSHETGAGHFVFANEGTWLGRLVASRYFKDAPGVNRAQVHENLYRWIVEFLGPFRE